MAGIYSPKNVGKLLFGGATATETTSKTFRSSASAGEIKVLSANGSNVAAGVDFKVFVKKADGTVEVSDKIEVDKVVSVKLAEHLAPTNKSVRIEGFTGSVRDDVTYRVSIRKFDHIQSPENFRHIHTFYVSPADASGVTMTDVLNELKANLDTALQREGADSEFTVTVDTGNGYFIVTAEDQPYVQGKKQGDQVQFDIEFSVKPNAPTSLSIVNYNSDLTKNVLAENNPGQGSGKAVANLEYFLNGYETTDYGREVGFPADFAFTPQASLAGMYNSVQIAFYSERDRVNVERQPKELTIVFDTVDSSLANNAETNAFLAQLRTALGSGNVPSDLATS